MQNLQNELIKILEKDERFTKDGKLLKNNIIEAALQLDPSLIKLLLSHKSIKTHFFKEIDNVFVFDKIEFQKFVSNKSFLKDSYTAYSNKIGLTVDDEFISEGKQVVLSWPYKDCVLEGGQTKEDEIREEIFWNETLAPDEIDRLLSPKVFTNFEKYDIKGKHKVTDISFQDNLIIKGNNLLSLHSLLPQYAEKINLIYIDPPFNTGNDSFNYNDKFSTSTWLTFMKNRLEVAKRLLTIDGNIFIHIDINHSHQLKIICDEIFYENNFVEEIIWSYGSPSGGRATTPKPVNIHDYILHYSKNYSLRKQNRVYTPYSEKYIKDWFKYKDSDGRIYQKRMRGKDEEGNSLWEKQYLDESNGIPLTTVWSDIKQVYADPRAYKANQAAHAELIRGFTGQKPEKLLQRIIEMSTDEKDIVLDYHLGTGTTSTVALKLNRRFIGLEQLEYGKKDSVIRLKNTIKGNQTGISKEIKWQGGGSFIYCELSKLNQYFVEKVTKSKNSKELKQIWEIIKKDGFISYKINPKDIDNSITEFEELSLQDQRKFLIAVLDKNHLYVNYSEIEDKDYKISEDDKKLNKKFYSLK